MPPPPSQRKDIDPPPETTSEAVKGFFVGALRFGSLSLLAHLILVLPHPMHFDASTTTTPTSTSSWRRPSTRLQRPLISLSTTLAPTSRIYRGLTPQFKVFLQLAAMTFGGCIWAEKRVSELREAVKMEKRVERRREEMASRYR